MAGNQHWYYWTITKIKQKGCYCGHSGLIYKMIWLKVTTTNVSLEKIIKIYWDEIWKIHRVPQKVLSNRGSQFALRFMEDLLKVLRTKRILSTAYCQKYKAWKLVFLFNISFSFCFDLFFFSKLRVRIMVMSWSHGHSNGHKSWDHREKHKRFWKNDIIQCV